MVKTILFATEYWPPFAPGGAEWTNAAWATALARRGRRVIVVTPNYGDAPRAERDGVTVVRVPFPIALAPGQHDAGWLVHKNPIFHLYFAARIRQVARAEGADILHAQNKGALVGAWLAARALRRPLVVTVRDVGLLCPVGACPLFEPWTTFDCSTLQYLGRCAPFHLAHYAQPAGTWRRLLRWTSLVAAWLDHLVQRRALRGAARVVGVSDGILRAYPPRLVDRARARVVHSLPPPVSPAGEGDAAAARARFGLGAAPVVLHAGKRSLGKGTPVLLAALDTISKAVPGVRFVFAGKGELALPERHDVVALGSVPQSTLFALYRAADVVVAPAVWPEPLSRVLLEAMRLGRPIVATRVGGTPEIVDDGVTGLLVAKNDPGALADAVISLLLDPVRRHQMGEAAVARADELFDDERLVDELLEVYEEAWGRPA
jgi:glycosyltransferase involved in cell wall biosynthesis